MDTLYFKENALKLAYAYNGGHSLSIGYNVARLGYLIDLPTPTNRIGPTLSLGILNQENKTYFTGSLSYSAHFYLVYASLNANYFSDFNQSSVFIAPEIGLSFLGRIYVGYSRQFSLFDNAGIKLKNQFNLGFLLPLKKTRRLYYVRGKRAENLD